MAWDGKGRRAEDEGRESLRDIVISSRSDLRNFIDNFEDHEKEDETKFTDHNKRILALERDSIRIYTASGLIAGLVAFIFRIWK